MIPLSADDRMAIAAMKKAVELGIFPEQVSFTQYIDNWNKLYAVIKAAIEAAPAPAPATAETGEE